MRPSLPALFAGLLLVGCGGPDVSSDPGEELGAAGQELRAPRLTWSLKATDASGASPVWKTSFPIASTYDVFLATEVQGTLSGHHRLTVYVNLPGGYAYQRFDVPFATDVAAAAGEQQAVRTSKGWRVWVTLPVAGTMIQTSALTGTWTAESWVDSATAANAKASFQLY